MKKIVLSLICAIVVFKGISQTGTPGNPFTTIAQARNVIVSGTYFFSINAVSFSTYVEAPGGWVLVASGSGTGATTLTNTNALVLQSDGILPLAVYTYSSLGVTGIRFNCPFADGRTPSHTPFEVQTTSATVITNLQNNRTLSTGLATFQHAEWTGQGPNDADRMEVQGPTDILPLNTHLYHADGNFSGFHWRLPNDENVFYSDAGRDKLNLWMRGTLSTLPVELISFDVVSQNDKIKLDWATATEINSSYFSIEKSLDGVNWQAIGKVAAAGNSNSRKDYTFYDSKPVNGRQFYRLRQVDMDAAVKYSGVKLVTSDAKRMIVGVFPNPVADYFNLKVDAQSFTNSSVKLIDVTGQVLFTTKLTSNSLVIDSRNLSKGYYILEVNLEGVQQRVKVVKN